LLFFSDLTVITFFCSDTCIRLQNDLDCVGWGVKLYSLTLAHASGEKSRKVAVTTFAGSTLAKVSFLCTVLLEEPETRHLAFRIGLYGMEMTRPPAASKSLEVCCVCLMACCVWFFMRI